MSDADVVIVGGGLAGLVAGVRAAELGRTAIVLERGERDGYICDSRVSTGVIHTAGESLKAEPDTIAKKFDLLTGGFANPALVRAFAASASRAIDWLQSHGAEFVTSGLQSQPLPRYVLAPTRGLQKGLVWQGWGPDLLLVRLAEALRREGGQLRLASEAISLKMTAGTCAGVHARIAGRETSIEASAVVLADGGFQGDHGLLRRFIAPAPEKLRLRSTGAARGDGLRMAESAGAALVGMERFYGHLLSRDALHNDALWPYPTLDLVALAGIVVDGQGKRVADEGRGGIYLANCIARRPDPLDCWVVFDDQVWQSATPRPGAFAELYPNPSLVQWGGTLMQADSLDALAREAALSADTFTATVSSFNKALEQGTGDTLDPPRAATPALQPVSTPPFYAVPACVGLTFTMGGPAVDEDCRVLRPDGSPIEGLFAAGTTIGGLEGGEPVGYWGGLSQALISGLRAAEYIADVTGR